MRLKAYKKWSNKLQITKVLVNERRNMFERQFRKISAVTAITNPMDVEGLLSFIERSADLRNTKKKKEKKVDFMKQEKARLEKELKIIEGTQIDYDAVQLSELQTELMKKEQKLQLQKHKTERAFITIANLQSCIAILAQKLEVFDVKLDIIDIQEAADKIVAAVDKFENLANRSQRSIETQEQAEPAIKFQGSTFLGVGLKSSLKR